MSYKHNNYLQYEKPDNNKLLESQRLYNIQRVQLHDKIMLELLPLCSHPKELLIKLCEIIEHIEIIPLLDFDHTHEIVNLSSLNKTDQKTHHPRRH